MLLVFILYALFGSVFVIEKTCLHYTQPLFLVGSRMILAGILMLCCQYFSSAKKFEFKKKHFWMLLRLGIFNIYFTNVFEIWALSHLNAFKTCFIYSLSPFLAALLSFFIFSEKLSKKKWIGLLIGCMGFIPILLDKTAMEQQSGQLFLFSWAEISMLLAVICSVYGWISLKQLVHEEGCSPFAANGLSMLIGGGIALAHSFFAEEWNPVPITDPGQFIVFFIALMIISNLICYNLYGTLLKKFSATFMSFAGFSTPLFTALFGWMFLGENVTWPFILSACIVFTGLVIFSQEEFTPIFQTKVIA